MAKEGISMIKGVKNPKIGLKYDFEVSWYEGTPSSKKKMSDVKWQLYKLRKNGKFTPATPVKKGENHFTFGQPALGETYKLDAYLHKSEGGGLIIKPTTDKIPRITKVELKYTDDSKGTNFSVLEKMRAVATTVNMIGKNVTFQLWEDDADGATQDGGNNPIAVKKDVRINLDGVDMTDFVLTDLMKNAILKGEYDARQFEFFVTAEYYPWKKHNSDNLYVNNSESAGITNSKSPQTAPDTKSNGSTQPVQQPAEPVKAKGTATLDKPPTAPAQTGRSMSQVNPTVPTEGISDAYFAKKEDTRQTGEADGTFEYTFGGKKAKNQTSNTAQKGSVADTILKRVAEKLKAEKKYTTKEAIVQALIANEYGTDSQNKKVTFPTFKLGAELKKITSAPLEDKVYLVARTYLLDGKEATITVKEKDGVIKGSADAVLPILEITEEQMDQAAKAGEEVPGTEKTEFKGTVADGLVKIPVHLRPKSDEDLKQWKEKLAKGKEDGTYTYKFASGVAMPDGAEKRKVAGNILNNAKNGLRGNPKIENGKTADIEDIVNSITKNNYSKDETISFKLYKKTPELLYLNVKAQGKQQHEKEFLKNEGAYFEIGKKCVCEEIIRAFLRTLRIGEGTGELIKSRDKKTKKTIYIPHDFEKGYTTAFGGNLITDLSDHPRINYGGSTAAGAYQVMKDTWDDPQYVTKKTFYNINSFSKENQDKFSILLMKHHPGCSDLLEVLLCGRTEEAIRSRASRIWASLPEKGDNSRYLLRENHSQIHR